MINLETFRTLAQKEDLCARIHELNANEVKVRGMLLNMQDAVMAVLEQTEVTRTIALRMITEFYKRHSNALDVSEYDVFCQRTKCSFDRYRLSLEVVEWLEEHSPDWGWLEGEFIGAHIGFNNARDDVNFRIKWK